MRRKPLPPLLRLPRACKASRPRSYLQLQLQHPSRPLPRSPLLPQRSSLLPCRYLHRRRSARCNRRVLPGPLATQAAPPLPPRQQLLPAPLSKGPPPLPRPHQRHRQRR